MKLTCEIVKPNLPAYLDAELAPADQELIEAHLGDCHGCQQAFETFSEMVWAVSLLHEDQPVPQRYTWWQRLRFRLAAVAQALTGPFPPPQPHPPEVLGREMLQSMAQRHDKVDQLRSERG